jgi:hypothetical protein
VNYSSLIKILDVLDVLKGARGSVVVKALCCSRKVAGSSPDEVDFLKLT